MIRLLKALLILQKVNAAQKSNFSLPPCENKGNPIKIGQKWDLKETNPERQQPSESSETSTQSPLLIKSPSTSGSLILLLDSEHPLFG